MVKQSAKEYNKLIRKMDDNDNVFSVVWLNQIPLFKFFSNKKVYIDIETTLNIL